MIFKKEEKNMRFNFKMSLYTILVGGILIIVIVSFAGILFKYNIGDAILQKSNGFGTANQKNVVVQEKKGISISFVGDILLASRIGININQYGTDYPFEKVKTLLSTSDFAVGNLESAVAVTGTPISGKEYTFRADPKVIAGIKNSGLDIVSLANNHVLDFGRDAFIETLRHIKDSGLNYIGAGEDIDEAYRPVIVEKDGKKAAVFAASRVIPSGSWYAGINTSGVAGAYNTERLVEEIENVRGNVDYVIVYLHWGTEREQEPNKLQKSLARLLIDSGADVVVGTHPHVLQGFEFYKGKVIAYSLGNFIFTNYNNPTVILNVVFDNKRVESVEVIPCMIKSYVPEPANDGQEKQDIYQLLEDRSINVRIVDGKLFEYQSHAE